MTDAAVASQKQVVAPAEPSAGERVRRGARATTRALRRNPNLLAGSVILTLMTLIALITATPAAKFVTRYDPTALSLVNRIQKPSAEHWFGTDRLGRDVYSRTLHGAKVSLVVAASVAVIVTAVGLTLGIAVGYSRVADNIVMRILDGMMSFPTLVLALALVATLGSSLFNVILVICIVDTPGMTRVVRGVVLSLRERSYVESARAIGSPLPRILFRHIAPNTLAPVIIQASVYFAGAILTESALGFLGVGTPEFIPSWGNIISTGREYVTINFWISFFPGLFLALTVLAANLVGDGLRDILDPRLRGAFS
jgi:peptide/nickel transport system permease protein